MTEVTPILSNPDFASLRSRLVYFLKSQEKYKDYNFEGSNLAVLIDLLAYNTYQNAFSTNMLASESFLDTAQLRTSVSSLAKHLGYLPKNKVGSSAKLKLSFSSSDQNFVIPTGTIFSSLKDNDSFNFVTLKPHIASKQLDGTFQCEIDVIEGFFVSESFTYNTNQTVFELSNKDVDYNTIKVFNNSENTEYVQYNSLIGVDKSTRSFFIEKMPSSYDQISFGDGSIGKKPSLSSSFTITYCVSRGSEGNYCNEFNLITPLQNAVNVVVETLVSSQSGTNEETVAEIKRNAPLLFQTRERAVTNNDFEIILKDKFGFIKDVAVFGGEELDTPSYGDVFLSVITETGNLSNRQKEIIIDYLMPRKISIISNSFKDYAPFWLGMDCKVYYNAARGDSGSVNNLSQIVLNQIQSFENGSLKGFNKRLDYSLLVGSINTASNLIISNDCNMFGILKLDTGILELSDVIFNSYNQITPLSLTSPVFDYKGYVCKITDDGVGNVNVSTWVESSYKNIDSVGTVNYDTGEIHIISNLFTINGNILEIKFDLSNNDVDCKNNNVIFIDPSHIQINLLPRIN